MNPCGSGFTTLLYSGHSEFVWHILFLFQGYERRACQCRLLFHLSHVRRVAHGKGKFIFIYCSHQQDRLHFSAFSSVWTYVSCFYAEGRSLRAGGRSKFYSRQNAWSSFFLLVRAEKIKPYHESMCQKTFDQIRFQFYNFQLVGKDVIAASKLKTCAMLAAWHPSLKNMMWWCFRNCKGNNYFFILKQIRLIFVFSLFKF